MDNRLHPPHSLIKVTSESPRTTEAELLLLWWLRFIKLCSSTVSNLKLRKILRKINNFRRNRSATYSNNLSNHRRNLSKNLEKTLLFVDFSKAFDSIHKGKMEQLHLTYGFSKETVTTIMMLNRNTKVKIHSPDGDTDYFEIVAEVLQGDNLALYLFIT